MLRMRYNSLYSDPICPFCNFFFEIIDTCISVSKLHSIKLFKKVQVSLFEHPFYPSKSKDIAKNKKSTGTLHCRRHVSQYQDQQRFAYCFGFFLKYRNSQFIPSIIVFRTCPFLQIKGWTWVSIIKKILDLTISGGGGTWTLA